MFLAAPAHAATVTATDALQFDTRYPSYNLRTVVYTAAPGEANRLHVSLYETTGVRLRDSAGLTASAPCVAEDAQTVVCPPKDAMILRVALGDGDDSMTLVPFRWHPPLWVEAGDGNDNVDLVKAGVVNGGAGDDTLTADTVVGGPGADALQANFLDYSDHAASVTVDLAGGVAGAAGENDQIAPGATRVKTGPGPDVIRVAGQAATVYAGAGDDVIDGGPARDTLWGDAGNDTIRGADGDDYLIGDVGNDRLEGGAGNDDLSGFHGDDVLDGGPGRDRLGGHGGADQLLARDGERDVVECEGLSGRDTSFGGDRATLDPVDKDSWCQHVTGARRLVLHGLKPAGVREARIVLSCQLARACRARLWVDSGRVASRVRVPAGRRESILVRRIGDPGVEVRITTPSDGVLRATFFGVRRR